MSLAATLAQPWREFPSARTLAEGSPPDRDRVVDLVRAVSLVIVVFGHSFMALVVFTPTGAHLGNTLADTPALQLATWVLQIMPLFFAAGTFANAASYRRATSYPVWLSGRVRRLLRPVLLYIVFWVIASPFLLSWNAAVALPAVRISTQLLWFLGVYLVVTALTPLLVRFSHRPVLATAGWLVAASTVDLSRLFGGPDALGLLNFVVVWALAGQTGLWVFTAAHRPRRSTAAVIAATGIGVNASLVAAGPWPRSLVGLPGERLSNMAPPSLVLGVHAVTLAGLVVLAYPHLSRLAARVRVWRATVAVNSAAMTIYLWHLVALIAAMLSLYAAGWDLVGYSTPGWLPRRLLFWALFATYTAVIVRATRPFEHVPLPWWDAPTRFTPTTSWPYRARATASVAGTVVTAVAVLALSVTGLVGFPFGATIRYAGFAFTPGIALLVSLGGILTVRLAAVGSDRPGRSWSTRR